MNIGAAAAGNAEATIAAVVPAATHAHVME
jgi:hypothetical protein